MRVPFMHPHFIVVDISNLRSINIFIVLIHIFFSESEHVGLEALEKTSLASPVMK